MGKAVSSPSPQQPPPLPKPGEGGGGPVAVAAAIITILDTTADVVYHPGVKQSSEAKF